MELGLTKQTRSTNVGNSASAACSIMSPEITDAFIVISNMRKILI